MIPLSQVLPFVFAIFATFCAAIGFILGSKFGEVGAPIGGFVGFVSGIVLWRLPWIFLHRMGGYQPAKKSNEELLSDLHENRTRIPNLILLELATRGYDIRSELPHVLGMLESEERPRRYTGWTALRTAFSEVAVQMPAYDPFHSSEICRSEVTRIRASLRLL